LVNVVEQYRHARIRAVLLDVPTGPLGAGIVNNIDPADLGTNRTEDAQYVAPHAITWDHYGNPLRHLRYPR